ncbi:MAG: glycerate kinase [Anaerolineaceae bacterium]|nr:glycerate kinase [Anaerolineaceae bacterium]
MKIIVAPGAFKHSLTALNAAEAIASGLTKSGLVADLVVLPIADGGNGTLDAFLADGGNWITVHTVDPLNRPISAPIGVLPDGETAVVEMALASGLELLRPDELNPLVATTYGTGLLLKAALDIGVKRIIVGMGGSATVDAGAGALQALGVHLLDSSGQPIAFGGGGLQSLVSMDTTDLDPRWREVELIIASDVTNPAVGENGAAAVFGPQKGATPDQIPLLDQGIGHFCEIIRIYLGIEITQREGSGAAGALSAGLLAFLGGSIQSGVDLLLDFNGFDNHLADADLVITGEGQMDSQTISGKGPIGVAHRALEHGVPTIALVGSLNTTDQLLHDAGIQAVLPIMTRPMPLADALRDAHSLLESAAIRLGYVLQMPKRG